MNVSLQKRRSFTITHDHNKEGFFFNTYNERKMIIIIIEISTSSALVWGPCGHSNEEVQGGGLITVDSVLGLRLARL